MKTFADLKRRLTVGTTVTMTFHSFGAPKLVNVPRKVEHVQTNALRFEGGSWLHWPKASEIAITGADAFDVLEEGTPEFKMSYTING